MSKSQPSKAKREYLTKLKNQLERIRPFLEQESFMAREIDTDNPRHDVKFLNCNGAIEATETKTITSERGKERPRTVWKWDKSIRERLLEYDQERTTMPECSHRVHIHNPAWADELACKHCQTEYSKDDIKGML